MVDKFIIVETPLSRFELCRHLVKLPHKGTLEEPLLEEEHKHYAYVHQRFEETTYLFHCTEQVICNSAICHLFLVKNDYDLSHCGVITGRRSCGRNEPIINSDSLNLCKNLFYILPVLEEMVVEVSHSLLHFNNHSRLLVCLHLNFERPFNVFLDQNFSEHLRIEKLILIKHFECDIIEKPFNLFLGLALDTTTSLILTPLYLYGYVFLLLTSPSALQLELFLVSIIIIFCCRLVQLFFFFFLLLSFNAL